MRHLRAVNRKAARVEEAVAAEGDVFALQNPPSTVPAPRPHYPPAGSFLRSEYAEPSNIQRAR